MKVYLIDTKGAHRKNVESIRETFNMFDIEYEEHDDITKINDTFTLAISFTRFYPPSAFPSTCKVIYGPHFFVVPDDKNHPLYHHTYDTKRFFFNTLSPWVDVLYREFCSIPIPFIPAFFGIDTQSIQSVNTNTEKTHIMIYFKSTFPERLHIVEQYISRLGIPYYKIIYGSYNDTDFKQKLQNTKFVIWIGRHESQGFALQETLASNIPILLWDVQTMYEEIDHGRITYERYRQQGYKMLATCAPVWSSDCGIKFYENDEFESAFQTMLASYGTFSPRKFVEETLSIPVAWHNLLKCIGEL